MQLRSKSRVSYAFCAAMIGAATFVLTLQVERAVAKPKCYNGVSCTIKNSNCGFWSGSTCANAGGTQDVDTACPMNGNGWVQVQAPCGTKLNWSFPYFCTTPTGQTCGTDSNVCPP